VPAGLTGTEKLLEGVTYTVGQRAELKKEAQER
jgi:hypothetical protein